MNYIRVLRYRHRQPRAGCASTVPRTMDLQALRNAEPIPGYRLIERIGRGGYGEVWKVEAPGGMHKAMKFVHGDMEGAGDDGKAAEQEFRSLNRVKSIRHPFLLSLERIEIIDGQLVIVMELADRNLWDRFAECVEAKLPGIPRPELLSYMEEAAEALDLMNLHHQIQHLDVKPQNIFLVHRHVKVADFGLAKDLEGARGKLTGGLTPMYAPPETFEEWVSRQSDQYSLAIVYQEMLTGRRPFNGTTTRQLVLQHLTGVPDVSSLPMPDRQAVARALAKKPEDRFETCMDFVRAVKGELPVPEETPSQSSVDPGRIEDDTASIAMTATEPLGRSRPKSLPALITPRSKILTPGSKAVRAAAPTPAPAARSAAPIEKTGDGVLFPAVVVGVGEFGLRVLCSYRRLIAERFGRPTLPHLRWLFVDTDPESIKVAQSSAPGCSLSAEEVVWTRLHRSTHYLSRQGLPPIESWLSAEDLYRMPRVPATDGMRGIGRLALLDHYHEICHRIRTLLEPFLSSAPVQEADRLSGLGMRSSFPRVFIANSLVGGTGSGMFLDMAYIIRRELKRLEFGAPHLVGLFGLPGSSQQPGRLALPNARAALVELEHFGRRDTTYHAVFDTGDQVVKDSERPFRRCAVVRFGDVRSDPFGQAASTLAHLTFLEMLSPIGRAAHPDGGPVREKPIAEVGVRRVVWPRADVVRAAGWGLCRKMLTQWLDAEAQSSDRNFSDFTDAQWAERKLDRTSLRSQLEAHLVSALGGPPQERIARAVSALHDDRDSSHPDATAVWQVVRDVVDFVGLPASEQRQKPFALGTILSEWVRVFAPQADGKLASLVLSMVEQPGLRLAGAEAVARLVRARIGQELELAEREAHGIEDQTREIFRSVQRALGSGADTAQLSGWASAAEARAALEQWAVARLHGLISRSCARLYQSILDNTPELVRALSQVRIQLSEFLKQIKDPSPAQSQLDGVCLNVFSEGTSNVVEAAARLLNELAPADLREFDNAVQARVRHQFRSLTEVCNRTKDFGAPLLAVMHDQAVQFLGKQAPRLTAVDILTQQSAGPEQLVARVSDILTSAAPIGLIQAPTTLTALGVPPGGERIVDIVRRISGDTQVRIAPCSEDVVVWREGTDLTLESFAHLAGESAPVVSADGRPPPSPHARNDIRWIGDF
jgi:eukaryotic-like serine/threonine-protein kinase